MTRFGGDVKEPERNRDNPYCCGAGGGLLFADKEEEPGTRISDVRFKQLQETGAGTVVTACPFCSIMLKGAQSSAPAGSPGADIQFVDLMTYVNGQLTRPLTAVRLAGDPGRKRIAGGRHRSRRLPAGGGWLGRTLRWRAAGARAPRCHRWQSAVSPSWRSGTAGSCRPRYYFRRRGIVVITSENFDGEWIAGIIERFGYGTARGSTSRGGRKALLQLKRDMAAGRPAAFTVDGPRGPGQGRPTRRRVAGEGDRPPGRAVSYRGEPPLDAWQLGSHADSRSRLPRWPLRSASRSTCHADSDDDGLEAARQELQQRLVALESRARELLAESRPNLMTA